MEGKKWSEQPPDEPKNVRTCNDCGTQSPEVETNYTLISSRHGWRLHRSLDAAGRTLMQWRCPECWARFRNRKTP
jgi:hypothetical protein